MAKHSYTAQAAKIAAQYGIPQSIFFNLIQHESSWTPNAVSAAGAIGLTQLMPATARGLKVNPWNPIQNMDGGARYLRDQYQHFKRWDLALAAYGWGPGAVEKAGGVPAAARGYVSFVLGNHPVVGSAGLGGAAPRLTANTASPPVPPSLTYGGGPTDISSPLFTPLGRKPGGFHVDPTSYAGIGADIASMAPPPPPQGSIPTLPNPTNATSTARYVNGEILLPTHFKSTHDTDGIDGYQPSIDITTVNGKPVRPYMPVGAPESGTIYRYGHAQGGHALYFRGDSGREYWIGHIENAGPMKHYKRGAVIAVVSPHHATPHVHIGILRE